MALVLIDTNLLIYLYDHNEPAKQTHSRFVLNELQKIGAGRLSVQNLSEFANIALKKISPVITASDVVEQIRLFANVFPVHTVTPPMVADAVRAVKEHQLPFYDAQMWSCARFNQIPIIFSEDFQDGQVLEGVRFVNPFAETFQLEKWI
ncbi:MAG: PIN domain-containing protein [Chloroflexota bacterium]